MGIHQWSVDISQTATNVQLFEQPGGDLKRHAARVTTL